MSDKKTETKKMCGLWHAHVDVSEHNNDGTCGCLDCFGGGCHRCKTYLDLFREINESAKYTRCQLCQGYDKTR